MNRNLILIILALCTGCNAVLNENDYLTKASENLDAIKSASYLSTQYGTIPGDTTTFSEINTRNYKIFTNPLDTLVGACSAQFSNDDSTKLKEFYDGNVRGTVFWDKEYVRIDSFKNNPYPFRLVYYPFYTKINEIIKYTLSTKDSIKTNFVDYGDSVHFSLKIIDKHTYFHIKPITITNDYTPEKTNSQFDIWFKKSDHMPYRMRSKWFHTTFFESISHARINTSEEISFVASEYYPDHFEIRQFKRTERKIQNNMLGVKAPDWVLKDSDNNEVKLSDLNSKVLLVQFTGIGCGPCHSSIPFLKQLVDNYEDEDFEFLSIETWSKNPDVFKRYEQNNGFNFTFLKSTEEVSKSYQVSAVPVFFVLDKDRTIRKVINGYSKEKTDKDIIEAIDKIL
jgi:thiol-disulfide isomerase/thioredoxin